MNRRRLSIVLGLVVSMGFLALALRRVSLSELWHILEETRWRWLPVMAVIAALDLVIRGLRWRILLSRSSPKASPWMLLRLEAVGIAINNVLFLRLGEFARVFLAHRELRAPIATVLASVVVERALDFGTLLALFCAAAPFCPGLVPPPFLHAAYLALAATILALFVLSWAEVHLQKGGTWERATRRFGRLHEVVAHLAAGAAVLREPVKALQVAALSLSLWAFDGVGYWAGSRALGLGHAMGYVRSVLVLSWAGAAAALPAAPGAFGTVEAFVKSLLVDFGVSDAQALAYAVFTHVTMYLLVTIPGLAFLYQFGISFGELGAAVRKMDKGNAP